jgi:DNA mismatch repair protein MutL
MENAVDAAAGRIDVEVSQGGSALIRVADDGCGIPAEDLPLALASHATSKLASAADLSRIGTLGFRGEALASVGSIAQVKLQSRPPDQAAGAAVTCHGGRLSPVVPWGGSAGTRVEVRHLFYNVPARRKFLKRADTEMGHVSEVFTRLALAELGTHWTLRHDGRPVYDVPASLGLLDRVGLFCGAEVRNSLYLLEAAAGPVTLAGYVGDPSCDRGGSELQYLFVNGRWVRDRGLFQAVRDAYRGLLLTGRHPVAFLFLEVPPERVDVNVHPAKAEVRFRDPEGLYRFAQEAVRDRLRAADLTARLRLDTKKQYVPASELVAGLQTRPGTPPSVAPGGASRPPAQAPAAMPAAGRSTVPPAPPTGARPPSPADGQRVPPPPATPAHLFPTGRVGGQPSPPSVARQGTTGPPPHEAADLPRAIQVLDCYLVVEVPPDEVLFVDQHAWHERILFEQMQGRHRAGPLESQRLLAPEPVSLPPVQAALVLEHREALAELGLQVEDFGGGTVLLAGYPALLGQGPPRAILRAVADHLAGRGRAPDRGQLLNDLLSLMACHAAVRAGDRLTPAQIAALLAQGAMAPDSHHCPHGRPTVLRFSRHDLERQFRRV